MLPAPRYSDVSAPAQVPFPPTVGVASNQPQSRKPKAVGKGRLRNEARSRPRPTPGGYRVSAVSARIHSPALLLPASRILTHIFTHVLLLLFAHAWNAHSHPSTPPYPTLQSYPIPSHPAIPSHPISPHLIPIQPHPTPSHPIPSRLTPSIPGVRVFLAFRWLSPHGLWQMELSSICCIHTSVQAGWWGANSMCVG